MTDVRTQNVIGALMELGFERRMANDNHALYVHLAGASASTPYGQPRLSDALLQATGRQVTGFGIAPADASGAKVHTSHRLVPEAIDVGATSADRIVAGAVPARSSSDRDTGGHKAAGSSKPLRRRAVAQ